MGGTSVDIQIDTSDLENDLDSDDSFDCSSEEYDMENTFVEFEMLVYIDAYKWYHDEVIIGRKGCYYMRWKKLCKILHNEDVEECKKFFSSIVLPKELLCLVSFFIVPSLEITPIKIINSSNTPISYYDLLRIMEAIRNSVNKYLNHGFSEKILCATGVVQRMITGNLIQEEKGE